MVETKRERVFAVVRQVILEVLGEVAVERIADGASLRELGANSIDRADVVALSMQALELRFPLRELADVGDIGGLVDALADRLPV